MPRRTKAQIELEKRVTRIKYEACANRPIPVMDLCKVSAAGEAVANAGGTDEEIRAAFDKIIDELTVKV